MYHFPPKIFARMTVIQEQLANSAIKSDWQAYDVLDKELTHLVCVEFQDCSMSFDQLNEWQNLCERLDRAVYESRQTPTHVKD